MIHEGDTLGPVLVRRGLGRARVLRRDEPLAVRIRTWRPRRTPHICV